MWNFIAITSVVAIIGMAMLGAIVTMASILVNLPVVALNAVIIPVSSMPAIGFLVWIGKERRSSFVKAQNIIAGVWIVSCSTVVGYVTTFLPSSATTAIISTTGFELLLGLLMYHITRKLYKKGRQRNIARSSGMPEEDPEVRTLADNQDLAIAILSAMLFTTKSIILMQSNFAPDLFAETTRVIGIVLGSSAGLIAFNFCPNQTRIREFISRSRNSER